MPRPASERLPDPDKRLPDPNKKLRDPNKKLRDPNKKLRLLLGLLAIIALYSVYNIYLDDNQFIDHTSRATRHVLRFATILIAYGIGVVVFTKNSSPWLVQVWHILYLGALLLLIVLGVLDASTRAFSIPFRTTVVTVHEFLISPVPYVIAWLIG